MPTITDTGPPGGPAGEPRPADPQTLFALGDLLTTVRELAELLEDAARRLHDDDDLTVAERRLLLGLRRDGPQPIPRLAARHEVSRQYIRQTLLPLAARGVIGWQPNPAHKRSRLAVLTPQGERLARRVMQREGGLLRRLAADLPTAPVAQAAELLQRLQQALLADQDEANML